MPRTSRSLQSATLSLGLVAIPVGLHATRVRAGRVTYHLVHKTCGSRVKRQYVCVKEDVPVTDDELTRSYEGDEGEEVELTAAEAKAVAPKSTGRIDLLEFVPTATIDPVFFDNAYYLAPGKGGDHAYHLLAHVLREEDVVAVGTQLARGKSYLIAVRATPLGMVMHTLHHAEEVKAEADVPHGEAGKLDAAEQKLARSLIDQLRKSKFDAAEFADDADDALRALIKTHGKKKAAPEAEAPKGKMVDLLATLKASLGGAAPKRPRAARGPRATARPSRARSSRSRRSARRPPARAR